MPQVPYRSAEPVLILGAGLLGRLLAVSLVRAGHPVRLVDAGPSNGTSAAAHVAAAMLAPLAESAVTEPFVVAMGQYALPRWRDMVASLRLPVYFQQAGTLILWHRQDAAQEQRFSALLRATANTLKGLPQPERLRGEALAQCEPAVADRFQQALYLPDEGQLDNRQLLHALLDTLETSGVAIEWNSPWTLEQAQNHQRQHGGWVLDCRGLGARAEWQNPQTSLRGVRGEVVRLHAPDVTLQRPTRLLHPRYPIYIAPKENHIFVIGATEIETDDLSPVSVRSAMELLSAAYTVHPGFGEARILELCSQCRPTLPDNLPAVHEVAPQVLQINGLYRHGFMISPAVHDAVLEHMHHGQQTLAQQLNLRFDTLGAPAEVATAR